MNARRFGVSTIWAMFSRVRSKTSGSSCSSRNALDLLGERLLLGRELEVHGSLLESDGSSDQVLTKCDQAMTPPARSAASASSLRPSSPAQHRVGVLADPRAPGSRGPRPSSRASPGCRARARVRAAVGARHLHEHVARRDVRVGDHVGRRRLLGPAAMPAAVSARPPRAWCASTPTPRPPGGSRSRGSAPTRRAVAKRGSSFHSGLADELGELRELVLADDLHDDVAVGARGSPRRSPRGPCPARAARPSTRSS